MDGAQSSALTHSDTRSSHSLGLFNFAESECEGDAEEHRESRCQEAGGQEAGYKDVERAVRGGVASLASSVAHIRIPNATDVVA